MLIINLHFSSSLKWIPSQIIAQFKNESIIDTLNYLNLHNDHNKKVKIFTLIDEIQINDNYIFRAYFIDSIDESYLDNLIRLKNPMKFMNDIVLELSSNFNINSDRLIVLLVSIEDTIYDLFIGEKVNLKESFFKIKMTDFEKNKIKEKILTDGQIEFTSKNFCDGLLKILEKIDSMINVSFTFREIIFILMIIAGFVFYFVVIKNPKIKDSFRFTSENNLESEKDENKNILEKITKIKNISKLNNISIENYLKDKCVICLELFDTVRTIDFNQNQVIIKNQEFIKNFKQESELIEPLLQENTLFIQGMSRIQDFEKFYQDKKNDKIEAIYVDCSHSFHTNCIHILISNKMNCPICEEKINFYINNNLLVNNFILQKTLGFNRLYSNDQLKNSKKDLIQFLLDIQMKIDSDTMILMNLIEKNEASLKVV